MMFAIWDISCEVIGQDNTSELSDIRLQLLSNFEAKGAQVVATIIRQGLRSQENGGTSENENYVLWFNTTKYVKLGQQIRRIAFAVDLPSKPLIYAFYKEFCERGWLCKGKVAFFATCMNETGIPVWCIQNC
jgi:hypothetical protein